MTMVTERQRRWVTAVLVLGTLTLGLVLVSLVGSIFFAFGDIVLVFFLAWLLAFILSPVVAGLTRLIPVLPRVGAVVLVYAAMVGAIVLVVVLIAGALAQSIADFIASVPTLRDDLPRLMQPWQERLDALGLNQVRLADQAISFLDNIAVYAVQLAGPVQQLAVASLGAMGNLLIVLILSLYMVIDRNDILSFLFRVVPPGYKEEARLLETSVARSFGGFLRGQAILGVVYAAVAAVTSAVLGIPYLAVTTAVAGGLMAIPFFGPFVAWAPPVIVALLAVPNAHDPVAHPHGCRLAARHEHPPAAPHAGGGRDPPDRRPRLGAHRLQDRRRHGRDLRDPDRRRHLGVLLPLPRRQPGAVTGRDAGGETDRGARGPAGPGAPRTRAGNRPGRLGVTEEDAGRPRRSDPVDARPEEQPDMTRERARTERRDLDKERGEPVAGGIARGGPRALRSMAKPLHDWSTRPKILITNDDGVESRGLLALKQALDKIGDTTVVAPDTNQSAVGHQKTLMRPLRVRERTLGDGSLAYSVDGSPTDAVSVAFLGFFGHGFDLVAAGINYGANLGDDITYSGTVSAAMEAVINNCPGFAISQEYYEHPDFTLAAMAAATVARNILEHGLSRGELINVNVPGISPDEFEGFEVTRLGRRVYQDQLIERVDPRGIPYFWIGGPPPSGLAVEGTDFHAIVNRKISITPIHLDLTGRRLLRRLKTWDWQLPKAERRRTRPTPAARPRPPTKRQSKRAGDRAPLSATPETEETRWTCRTCWATPRPKARNLIRIASSAAFRRSSPRRAASRDSSRRSGRAASAASSIPGSRPAPTSRSSRSSSERRSARTPSTSCRRRRASRSRRSCRSSRPSCR